MLRSCAASAPLGVAHPQLLSTPRALKSGSQDLSNYTKPGSRNDCRVLYFFKLFAMLRAIYSLYSAPSLLR